LSPISFKLSSIPTSPGVYAMYDKRGDVAYVGATKNLRTRIDQHIYRRDSSVTTGVSATCLNPDKVSSISWWIHGSFNTKDCRAAAEIIASEILNPALRSRGAVRSAAEDKVNDKNFRSQMERLFKAKPAGSYVPKNLDNLVELVIELEGRVSAIEEKINTKSNKEEFRNGS
jgi:hypothetical protein